MSEDLYALEFDECEKENLTSTGQIQTGIQLIIMSDGEVVASAGCSHLLEHLAASLQDAKVLQNFGPHSLLSDAENRIWLHHQQDRLDVFERPVRENISPADAMDALPFGSNKQQNIWQLAIEMCKHVKSMINAERVMVYRFDDDACGEVIAEVIEEGLEPFLGLKYPPTDIPKQARELFLRNRTRHIFSLRETENIQPHGSSQQAENFDSSLCLSRHVSPYHVQYLNNMGTASTASAALISNGKLWGLVSLHFDGPREPSLKEFVQLQSATANFEKSLQNVSDHDADKELSRIRRVMSSYAKNLHEYSDAFLSLLLSPVSLHKICGGQGNAVLIGNEYSGTGRLLPAESAAELCKSLGATMQIFETAYLTELRKDFPELHTRDIAGCSVTKLAADSFLLCFRLEQSRSVAWGGDPRMTNHIGNDMQLTPRSSFNIWMQRVEGKSSPWTQAQREILDSVLQKTIEFFEVEPGELVLLIKNGMRQALRKKSQVRAGAIEIMDGLQTAITIAAETDSAEMPNILALNSVAADAFAISSAESNGMPLNELSDLINVDFAQIGRGKKLQDIVTANKGIRTCEITVSNLFEYRHLVDADKKVKINLFEFRDITESQRVTDAMDAARQQADKKLALKSEAIAQVSHELKTPLNAIIGLASLLQRKEESFDDKSFEIVKNIYQSGIYMADLIESNLVTAINENSGENGEEYFSPVAVINEVADMTRQLAKNNEVEIHVDAPQLADEMVYANPRAFRQVAINLLSNAIKYNSPGGDIWLQLLASSPRFITFTVRDTGMGMTPEQCERCMEPFIRFTNVEGAGLGLSITKKLVELMGGKLLVNSVLGEGTSMSVELPRIRGAEFPESHNLAT